MKRKVVVGYDVREMVTDKPLPTCPYGSCGININGEWIILQSYLTNVCGYNVETGETYCNGTFSTTTRKHIGCFAKWLNAKYSTNFSYDYFKSIVE